MARPEKIQCEVCGTDVTVAARGKIPRFCAEHTSADLPTHTSADLPTPGSVFTTGAPVPSAAEIELHEGEVVRLPDDEWPQQVAPLVWVGPNGERWTDQAAAELGMAELRRKSSSG